MLEDKRNVIDEYKGMTQDAIRAALDRNGVILEIAIENTLRDYNMGTIVRTANAFGVRNVHVVGRRQWNKRGAMMTDKYLTVRYYDTFDQLIEYAKNEGRALIAVDNVKNAEPLNRTVKRKNDILLFGQEGPGLSKEGLEASQKIVEIEQYGSTRSLNVGVAAGIVMYQWVHDLTL